MPKYYLCSKDTWHDFGSLTIEEGNQGQYNRNKFFEACKDKNNFLNYINIPPSGETPPPILTKKLTEREFIKPPEEIQRQIYDIYKDISDQYKHDPTFWLYVHLEMIKEDIIEPSFLANDDRFNGKQTLDFLTNNYEGNVQDRNNMVRKILRRLCNTAPRGKRTLSNPNDCPISGVYWRQALIARIEQASDSRLKAKEIANRFTMNLYVEICGRLFSGKSYYGDPRILAGLVIFLKQKPGIKKETVKNLLEGIGKIIAWKAIDMASLDEIAQEFASLAETN